MEKSNLLKTLDNGYRILNNLKSGDSIFIFNKRKNNKYVMNFKKINGSSFKITLSENNEVIKESKLLVNGKLSVLSNKSSLITLFLKNNDLLIAAPDEIEFYKN